MSLPAYNPDQEKPSVKPGPEDGPESVFVVHASFTTDLHYPKALNEAEALGLWLGGENVKGQLICGRLRQEPFRHLEARIDTGSTHEQVVHVANERILESVWWGDLSA